MTSVIGQWVSPVDWQAESSTDCIEVGSTATPSGPPHVAPPAAGRNCSTLYGGVDRHDRSRLTARASRSPVEWDHDGIRRSRAASSEKAFLLAGRRVTVSDHVSPVLHPEVYDFETAWIRRTVVTEEGPKVRRRQYVLPHGLRNDGLGIGDIRIELRSDREHRFPLAPVWPVPVAYCHSRGLDVGLQGCVQSGAAGKYDAQVGSGVGAVPAVREQKPNATCSPLSSPLMST